MINNSTPQSKPRSLVEQIATVGASPAAVAISAQQLDGLITPTARSPHWSVTVPSDLFCFGLETLLTLAAKDPPTPDWARHRRQRRRRRGRSRPADERCLGSHDQQLIRAGHQAPPAPAPRAGADVAALTRRVEELEEAIVRLLAHQGGSPNGRTPRPGRPGVG